ncbi:hypothetical protein [Chryseobacterium sp.]|uniref:hypothetical protein n=1 Tax=Chryseobacterium sp. TaxID=1871047 RepID=UPI0028A067FC|nr:hypothetical protein [Chryseobacterium sp.]
MEKLHKYCLSVLLVIICSNISAQINNGNLETEDCRKLYELYHQILNQDVEACENLCVKGNFKSNSSISKKQNAIDLIGKIFPSKNENFPYKNKSGNDFSVSEKDDQILKSFEEKSKNKSLAQILYFKTKVSKVRNKDYLEVLI